MTTAPHPAVALVLRAAATLADAEGIDHVDVHLRAGAGAPDRAALEAALGPAAELPRIAGPAFHRLAFRAPAGVTLLADLDDETGRATTLTARRDAR